MSTGPHQTVALATIRSSQGDTSNSVSLLSGTLDLRDTGSLFAAAWLLLDAGALAEARRAIDRLDAFDAAAATGPRAQLSLIEGRVDDAIAGLTVALTLAPARGYRWIVLSRRLGSAWLVKGDITRAVAALEQATQGSPPGISPGWDWIGMRTELARLYRQTGRTDRAEALEREVSAWRAVAEPETPSR